MEFKWNTYVSVQGGQSIPCAMFRQALIEKAVEEKLVITAIEYAGHGSFDKVEEAVKSVPNIQKVMEQDSACEGYQAFYITPTGSILVNCVDDDDIHVHVDTVAPEDFEELTKILGESVSERPPQGQVMMLARETQLYLSSLGRISDPLARKNYTEEQLAAYDGLVEELQTDNPSGRIALLDGPPGTGKSFFIRGLITEIEALFVFVPASILGEITGPDIMSVLLAERYRDMPIVLIMEDADASLATRQMDNVSRLSDILNISDGILGDLADIRIVATTNQKQRDIDPAILRAGRMSYHVTFKGLTSAHAESIFEELTGLEITDEVRDSLCKPNQNQSLADVYKLARKHGWKPPVKRKKKRNRGYPASETLMSRLGIY